MGYKRFCDATRELEEVPGTFEEFGQVLKRQYAPDPAKDVSGYFAERDRLHDRIAKMFRSELEDLTDDLIDKWPDIYLPDETDEVAEKRISSRLVAKPKRKRTRKNAG